MISGFTPPEGFRYEYLAAGVPAEEEALRRGAGWSLAGGRENETDGWFHYWVSVKPACPPAEARSLAVIAGRFAADAIGGGAVIHWPTSIVLSGKCVCRVRCRARDDSMVFRFSVDPACLADRTEPDPGQIMADTASSLAAAAAACPDGLPGLLQSYCEKCVMLMKFVDVTYRGMPLYGFAFAVDKNGGLMVMTQESHTVVTVYSGEAKLAEREPEQPEMPPSPSV